MSGDDSPTKTQGKDDEFFNDDDGDFDVDDDMIDDDDPSEEEADSPQMKKTAPNKFNSLEELHQQHNSKSQNGSKKSKPYQATTITNTYE